MPFRREVEKSGGDEIRSFEDLEVAFCGVVALGAVDDGLAGGVPSNFLQREWMAEQIIGQAFATGGIVGGDRLFSAVVDAETGVFPGEEIGQFFRTDEFGLAEGVEEAVAEEFDGGSEVLIRPRHQRAHPTGFGLASVQNASDLSALFNGHAVEVTVGGEESVGGKDMEVGVVDEIVSEGVKGGDGSDAGVGKAEADPKGILEGGGISVEEVGEQAPAFAKDAAQDAGNGEDELTMGNFVADRGGVPFAGGADAALVAGGAEVAAFAGEGEESFVPAVGTLQAGEA
ncbi:hypothetical protein N8529_00795 [bacterium]|nr:hypothetical protein [bacterium]